MSIGAAMAGGNPLNGREEDDFYPTPPEVTRALMEVIKDDLIPEWDIHEPCCGNGMMARVIEEEYGFKVVATDINPRDYGEAKSIFDIKEPWGDVVITNPPFNLAEDIINHVFTYFRPFSMALLLKSTYFHADERTDLFNRYRPSMIMPLPWRPDFMGLGRPTMEVVWVVWTHGFTGYPIYRIAPNFNPKKKKRKKTSSSLRSALSG